MRTPLLNEPEKWQTAFTSDDAYRGFDASEFYLSTIGRVLSLAFWCYVFYLTIKYVLKPLFEMVIGMFGITSIVMLLVVVVAIVYILFSMPFSFVRNFAFRYAASFFSELYLPPENVEPGQVISYRLGGKLKLPMPLSELFSSISQFKYILVKDGEIVNGNNWVAWQARNIGGPISLIVFDGCALYLERGNRFSRVVGPGAPFLEWYETIKYVVDLRPKVIERPEFDVWTKDGINIKLKVRLECRIGDPKNVPADNSLVYPFDPIAVKKAIERYAVRWPDPQKDPEEFTWEDAAWGQVTGIIPSYIGSRMLDDILVADRNGGQILSPESMSKIFESLNKATNIFGVHVTGFQILSLKLPPQVRDHHVEYWKAERQSIVTMIEGQAKAFNIRAREKARADAQHDLLMAIVDGLEKSTSRDESLGDTERFIEPLLLSFSGILDESLSDPSTRAYLARDTLDVLERLRDMLDKPSF